MDNKEIMSGMVMREFMQANRNFFDYVRLVDPQMMCEMDIDEKGRVFEISKDCHAFWNIGSRCSNCTSLFAQDLQCVISKTEDKEGKRYHIMSKPVVVRDATGKIYNLVMEFLALTRKENRKDREKILVVEDQDINRAIIVRILQEEYDILEASDGEEALNILEEHQGDISAMVLDLIMPGVDGYEVMRRMAKDVRYNNIPVLVTTGDANKEIEKKCLNMGAWDFVTKPIDKETLRLRLHNIIGRSNYNNQCLERYISEHDNLTGLYNRDRLFSAARDLLDENPNQTYAFVRIDLDKFHLYNNFFGEEQGDKLLIFMSQNIRKIAESLEGSVYGRIDSDIFGICMPYQQEIVLLIQNKILDCLKEYNRAYYIEPSIGVCVIKDRRLSMGIIYDQASMAAKSCKHKFMSYIGYYDDNMTQQIYIEQEIMNEAQRALDEEQFVVYLQPKIRLSTEEPCGAEALVRWKHPKKGLISPGKFIPVFESNGFIGKLDYYMWEHTCMLLKKWCDNGWNPKPVSVNVSMANMYNPNLCDQLVDLVEKYELSPKLLQLELTESVFVNDPDMMIKKVESLQENGFTILMDDFGSGYSSLNTLKDIPVDILKLDMKFLSGEDDGGKGERILASVVRMASWLDLPVIVEGVETEIQKNFLNNIGCEFVQGFYFARPMPWEEYEEILKNPHSDAESNMENSEAREVVEAIWNTNPELDRLFDSVDNPVAVLEYANRNVYPLRANEAFERCFGSSITKQGVLNYKKSIPEQYVRRIFRTLDECAQKKKISYCEYFRIQDNGAGKWHRLKVQYVRKTPDGFIILAYFGDITEEKTLEQEVHRYKVFTDEKMSSHMGLLVVDDDEVTRAIMTETFKNQFDVICADNGKSALEILENNEKDIAVILLDMEMPVMNGQEFLEYKNANDDIADIPVIVISSDSNQHLQVNMLDQGVNDYITKPFVPEIVERRVYNVLEFRTPFK